MGRSGGGGGGGGGGFSGGGFSSGGRSHGGGGGFGGGGFGSGGRSHGGGFGGGFGGGGFGGGHHGGGFHGGHHGGHHHHHVPYFGGWGWGGGGHHHHHNSGCGGSGCLVLLVLPLILLFVLQMSGQFFYSAFDGISDWIDNSPGVGSLNRAVEAEPDYVAIDPSLAKAGAWFADDNTGADAWFQNKSVVESAMQGYYDATGVRPFLHILKPQPSKQFMAKSNEAKLAFAKADYDDRFRDKAHALFIIADGGDADYAYYDYIGADAAQVVDLAAVNLFYDELDVNWKSSKDTEDVFADSFTVAVQAMQVRPFVPEDQVQTAPADPNDDNTPTTATEGTTLARTPRASDGEVQTAPADPNDNNTPTTATEGTTLARTPRAGMPSFVWLLLLPLVAVPLLVAVLVVLRQRRLREKDL